MNGGVTLGFLDSVKVLPFTLRRLLDAFGLPASKTWYPTTLTLRKTWTLDYVGLIPGASFYGVNEMSESFYVTKVRNPKSSIIGTCWELTIKMTSLS